MSDVTDPGAQRLPLEGIRVLEAGVLLAGPYCGQLLGDLGAEVIKIEQPGTGDPIRQWGHERPEGKSLWWPIVARNKKSVELDLRTPAGQEAFLKLAAMSDIVLENFRAGVLEGWNLGYEQLRAVNPGVIFVRVTGYGQTGPYAKKAGYAAIGEAMGGLRHVVGYPDRPPSRVGISIGDSVVATFAALGALAALHERSVSGEGQVVDCAIYEAVLAYMEAMLPEYAVAGHIRERTGTSLANVAPSNLYPTADGSGILIAGNQDTVFRRLAQAMGAPELVEDERYATHVARGLHQAELDELVGQWTIQHTAQELQELLDEHGVPAGAIYRAPEILADPHVKARQAVAFVEAEGLGKIPMQNVVPKLSRTPGRIRWTGPALGAHNREVLIGLLGLTETEMAAARGEAG
jgi:crotonobetainyl-CoA:carnitine CoA-transferase CaiB-like acyl-CoA transferase